MLKRGLTVFISLLLVSVLGTCGGKMAPKAGGSSVLKAVLIMQDDYDDPGLNNIADSVRADFSYISKFLDVLEKYDVINVDKIVIRGSDATKDNILNLIKKLKVNKNDVLMVYFSGHGGMENYETFLETADMDQIFRSELEKLVKSKDAKLKLVFTDACSSSIDGLIAVKTLGGVNKAMKKDALVEIYKNLFLNYEGMLYMTAASEGEYAWSGDRGGAFTESLIYETLLQNPKPTWDEVCKSAKKKTQDKFQKMISMGLIDPGTLKDMKKQGIKNQSPKSYSMPKLKKNDEVAIDDNKISDYEDADNVSKADVKLKNNTSGEVSIYLDNNKSESDWDLDNTEEIVLDAGESISLTADSDKVTVFFIISEDEGNFFELASGKYLIDYVKKKELGIFNDEGVENNVSDDSDWWVWDDVDSADEDKDELNNLKDDERWNFDADDYEDSGSDDDEFKDHFFGK